jgi:hypothetical protein
MSSFKQQVKDNLVAIISLVVAVAALSHDTWRNDLTEKNRNLRQAAFMTLSQLSDLQLVINYMHYQPENPMGNLFIAWGHIAQIGDLAKLLPEPVPSKINGLIEVWKKDYQEIGKKEEATEEISQQIDTSRQAVFDVIYKLR